MDPPLPPLHPDRIPHVWRAESLAFARTAVIATGHPALDAALGGGWPTPSLIEVLCDHEGIGELQLLRALWQPRILPASSEQRSVVLWLDAPFAVNALALAQLQLDPTQHWCAQGVSDHDALWAMEQALRSGSCALVMTWSKAVTLTMLRRLKLAACVSDSIGVLFRPGKAAATPSPANVRLRLRPVAAQLQIELLKVQSRRPSTLQLAMHVEPVQFRHVPTQPSPTPNLTIQKSTKLNGVEVT